MDEMELRGNFAYILKRLRKNKKMSQEKLALNSNLDRTYISLLERGVRNPTLPTIFKLSIVLEITPSQFIKQVEEITYENKNL
ncbi:putative transcriptional regulator [Priestia megaterium Q3]|uniref:Putative transcriptional regulator n=1 Tax=Priestia megaterium Q3 TaxID=1452722 RepID=A0A806TS31_PRIMG|nr:helix-turn-helix transcriptional regulator [Priestia megaterium]AKP77167.1 putative transcriptional regulator [Priestia megaterium Q3]